MGLSIFDFGGLSIFGGEHSVPVTFLDDIAAKFGTGGTAEILYNTDDDNANCLMIKLPEQAGADVPVLVIGDTGVDKDLATWNGTNRPLIAFYDADEDSWLRFYWRLDDNVGIGTNAATMAFQTSTSYYLTLTHTNNVPTLFGTGAYLRIGDAATTSQSLASEDDLMVSGKLEVDGYAYFDGRAYYNGRLYAQSDIYIADDKDTYFGGSLDAVLLYETADADAMMMVLTLPHVDEESNNVAVLALVDRDAHDSDLGASGLDFSGITDPTLAIGNEATDAYVTLDAGDSVGGSGKGLYFKAAADEDIELINLSVTGTPRMSWDESVNAITFKSPVQILGISNAVAGHLDLVRNETIITVGEALGEIAFDGVDNQSTVDGSALIRAYASQTHTASAKGGYLTFWTKADNTAPGAVATERIRIGQDGAIDAKGHTLTGNRLVMEHHTSDDTLTKEESGSIHTNLGEDGAVTLTLPQDAVVGTWFRFTVMYADELRIDPGAAGAIYINGAKQTDDKYITANDEGEAIDLVNDGNGDWASMSAIGTWGVEG